MSGAWMEYHWMYRRRFGQDARSLDETARGQWPIYRPALPAAPVLSSAQAAAPAVPPPDGSQAGDANTDCCPGSM